MKEIHEQPRVMSQMIKRFVNADAGALNIADMGLDKIDLKRVTNIHMVACGTAYYSAVAAKYMIEPAAGLPVNVELASEFRYRSPWLNKESLVIAVSQSGETADTLACVKHAKEAGAQIFSICNVKMSSIPRESHATLYMEAGPEIGVASTKAFTNMSGMAKQLTDIAEANMQAAGKAVAPAKSATAAAAKTAAREADFNL
jgi:glucosamine--fructose-6-phosphate aminotransferase (isomerizing)